MREAWHKMSGVDLTAIDAAGVGVVQVVLSEYGSDLRVNARISSHLAVGRCGARTQEGYQWRQAATEEETRQRQQSPVSGAPLSSIIATAQPDGTGGLFPPCRPAPGSRRGCVCHR